MNNYQKAYYYIWMARLKEAADGLDPDNQQLEVLLDLQNHGRLLGYLECANIIVRDTETEEVILAAADCIKFK